MRFHLTLAAALAMALMASTTFASVDNQSLQLQDIREQQSQLQIQVRAGKGAFKDMSESERRELLAKQDRVLTLLQGKQSAGELSVDDRLEVFNTLEEIKGAVAKAEDERKICKRTKTVTSNVPQVVCMTAAQQREQQERARNMMQRAQKCADASCISAGG
jgi:hypothetical protein